MSFFLHTRRGDIYQFLVIFRTTGGRRAAKNQRRVGFSIHQELEESY